MKTYTLSLQVHSAGDPSSLLDWLQALIEAGGYPVIDGSECVEEVEPDASGA